MDKTPEYVMKLASRAVDRFGGRLPSSVERQDALQDAAVIILDWWDKWTPLAYACELEPFLVMKAWGALKDRYGAEWKREYAHHRQPLSDSLVGADQNETRDLQYDVRMAVDNLPGKYARVMHLLLDGLTQEQVAQQLGVGQSYVSQIVVKSKAKLKKTLGAYA